MGSLVAVVALLWWQYNDFLGQTERLVLLQGDYQSYVDVMRKVLREQHVDIPEEDQEGFIGEDDIEVDSFMVINRQPEYLKESTISFLKEQQLESLVSHMNFHELQNYTDQLSTSRASKNDKKKSKRSKKADTAESSIVEYAAYETSGRIECTVYLAN